MATGKKRIHQGHLFMLEDDEPKKEGDSKKAKEKEVSAKDVLKPKLHKRVKPLFRTEG